MEAVRDSATPDLASRLLDSVRVRSTIYCRSTMGAPWGFSVEGHGNPSFHFIMRGSCWLEVDGEDDPLALLDGDLIVLPKGQRHSLRDQPGSPTEWLDDILAAMPPDADGRLRHGGEGTRSELLCGGFLLEREADPLLQALPTVIHVRRGTDGPAPWVSATLELIGAVAGSNGAGAEAVLRRLADAMLAQALRLALAELEIHDPAKAAALRDPQIAKGVDLIHRDHVRAWTVDELARAVGYSRSAFASRFRQLVGESPISYLTRTRLAIAATQLQRTDATLGEIALRVGYSGESSFSRAFKRAFGVSPGAYREKPSERPIELTAA